VRRFSTWTERRSETRIGPIFRTVPSRYDVGRAARRDGIHLAVVGGVPRSVPRSSLLLTVPDTARRLRRHEQTVRAMIRRGDLAAVRLGRLVRVLTAAVEGTLPVPLTADREAVPPAAPRRAVRRLLVRAKA